MQDKLHHYTRAKIELIKAQTALIVIDNIDNELFIARMKTASYDRMFLQSVARREQELDLLFLTILEACTNRNIIQLNEIPNEPYKKDYDEEPPTLM